MSTRRIELVVDPESVSARMRLDRYLKIALETLSPESLTRTQLQRLISEGKVLVDGEPKKPSLSLSGGERITVEIPDSVASEVLPQEIPLSIMFEDAHLLVVDKPAGMVVHPGAGVTENTLVNALLSHCKESLSGIGGVLRPGIVHRLDKDTSGLLVVAKNDRAHVHLSRQISERKATRVYLALLEGSPPHPSGLIDRPIARHKIDRKKMAVTAAGRRAVTHYEVIRTFDRMCLARLKLETGRTHQIRVHMASINCPVVGDLVYNRKTTGSEDSRLKLGLRGQALHATYLSFAHPVTGCLLEFHSKLPEDFQRLIDSLAERTNVVQINLSPD